MSKPEVSRILDVACGAGRHVVYMAKHGFEVYGIDISGVGLKMAKQRLLNNNLDPRLVRGDMKRLPYSDRSFAALTCTRAVYHQGISQMSQAIEEMRRVLIERGLILIDFMSSRSFRYGRGNRIEDNTFIQEDGPERGVPHHFTDEEEIEPLLSGFIIIDVKLNEKIIQKKRRSHLTVVAMKEG